MKKIFAIMMIAVIAVAGVFATTVSGTTSLNLTYGITSVFLPKFGITYDGGDELAQGANVAVTTDAESNGIIASTSASFAIVDHTRVNAAHTMIIGISLTDGQWVGEDGEKYSAITITNYSVVPTYNITDRAVAAATVEGVANTSVTMTYGKAGVDRSAPSDGKTIATFKVTWEDDLTAPAQAYHSTLTISPTAI